MDKNTLILALLGVLVVVSLVQAAQLVGMNGKVNAASALVTSAGGQATGGDAYAQMLQQHHGSQAPASGSSGMVGGCGG